MIEKGLELFRTKVFQTWKDNFSSNHGIVFRQLIWSNHGITFLQEVLVKGVGPAV